MLLTNGQWVLREKYENNVASTIQALVSAQYKDRLPIGCCKVSMTYRFAGLHNPSESPSSRLDKAVLCP
jgi:hypothetical protein